MRHLYLLLLISFSFFNSNAQTVQDDFEGSGTITSWSGDDCGMNNNFPNPYKQGINTSNTVLKYDDIGGTYANVRFDVPTNFNISDKNVFVLKIYVPSSGLTGSQQNQVSLKLQNNTLTEPWTTQTEIKKTILLNQWQEITFDFINDGYININGSSGAPKSRTDLNRVVIQINGEDNSDKVVAYIDDLNTYSYTAPTTTFNNLVWADEFDVAGPIDGTKWFHQTQLIAGNSWANGEVQHYTNREANSYVSNGTLKIKAIKESYTDQGVIKQYTSARLNSKIAFKYGRVEARAKLPSIAGTWPAIWLLGKNINEDGAYWDNQGFGTTSWPQCGEIDIMEPNIAKTQILATWHWDNGSGYQYNSNSVATNNTDTSQNFHDYVLEWDETSMKIYMDDVLINQMPTVNPFNQEYFILLNLAMGGNLGGAISPSFTNDIMEIDYIRVYQSTALSTNNPTIDSEVKIYPNPVKDTLNINLGNIFSKEVHVRIYDISGRVMFKEVF